MTEIARRPLNAAFQPHDEMVKNLRSTDGQLPPADGDSQGVVAI